MHVALQAGAYWELKGRAPINAIHMQQVSDRYSSGSLGPHLIPSSSCEAHLW